MSFRETVMKNENVAWIVPLGQKLSWFYLPFLSTMVLSTLPRSDSQNPALPLSKPGKEVSAPLIKIMFVTHSSGPFISIKKVVFVYILYFSESLSTTWLSITLLLVFHVNAESLKI